MKARITLDEERFEQSWRTCTYLIYNCALSLQLASQATLDLDPTEYVVFSVIACGNLQRRMRELGALSTNVFDHLPSNETNVPMSRRRLAEATGLPRETVRRIVARLLERGLLIQSPDGMVMVPVGLIRGPGSANWQHQLIMGPVLGMMQSLLNLGAIRASGIGD